jgi:hypothetical protein
MPGTSKADRDAVTRGVEAPSIHRPLELSDARPNPPDLRGPTKTDVAVALFAFVAIALHDGSHLAAGRYWDVFWVCNVAALLVAPAIVFRSSLLAAASLTWLLPGTLVWLADTVFAGSHILWTSYAVHFGGTAAALYATRRNGVHPRGWVAALVVLVAVVLVSRLFLPPHANVNAAHAVPRGWGFLGSTRVLFATTTILLIAVCCMLGRFVGKRVARTQRAPATVPSSG